MINETNELKIINKEYNFKDMYDELVNTVNEKLKNKSLEFKTSYNESIPNILYGDSIHIKQILLNLLMNAINYTNEGTITFSINYILRDDIVKLVAIVEDTGIGIKDDEIDGLFHQNNSFTTTKELLKLMNAKIAVQSKYGEGSKFTVYIEQNLKNENNNVENNINEETISFSGKKVLVVDDDPINLKISTKILEEYKLEVTAVNDGMSCIDKVLEGNKYDLIIIDQMMPQMSGEDTLYNLKKIIGFNTPVIAISTNENEELKNKAIQFGFIDYLVQPIDKKQLKIVLSKLFSPSKLENVEKELTGKELLEANGVDLNSSLEFLGDMETYDETANEFLNESKTRFQNIDDYKNISDMANYSILVHAMKSDSKYLGFMKLAELSYNHEMASKSNDIDYVNQNYDELMNEAKRIIELIRKYLCK